MINKPTRQTILGALEREQMTLNKLLPRFSEREWRSLTRDDDWSVHDIAAHIADIHLTTVAISGLARRLSKAPLGVTLPMTPKGRINIERLNMLRFQVNRSLSRKEVMAHLNEAFDIVAEALNALDDEQLAGPGPYEASETMLEWFDNLVLHMQEHRWEMEQIYAQRS